MVELSVALKATAPPEVTVEPVSICAEIVLNVPLTEKLAPMAGLGPCPETLTATPTDADVILLLNGLPAWLDSAVTVTVPDALTVALLTSASMLSAIWFQPRPMPQA